MPKPNAERARVAVALGEHRMIPIAKDDVIEYLAVTDWPADRRERLYLEWCKHVGVSALRSDIQRVKQARRRESNRAFEW